MLGYGLVFGTILLSCMLVKTCTIDTHPRNHPRRQAAIKMGNNTRANMLNETLNHREILDEIAYHENSIKKLKQLQRENEVREQERREI